MKLFRYKFVFSMVSGLEKGLAVAFWPSTIFNKLS